jgi:hypothetical protein
MQVVALSLAVQEQLSADACARSFALSRTGVLDSLRCVLSGYAVTDGQLLGRQLCNPVVELLYERTARDRLNHNLINLSALSLEALDAVLARGSFSVKSEDELLERLLSLCEEYRPLLRWVEMKFLSASGLAALVERLGSLAEWTWGGIADHLLIPPLSPTPVLDSAIISGFPDIFAEFRGKRFWLLWRGSRDGVCLRDFHRRCDGHANTLTVILDTDGNVFGGFTPVEWESHYCWKADASLKSFLFTLKNPHNVPAWRFALKAEKKDEAIFYSSGRGPDFCDIGVWDNCNENTDSFTYSFGTRYTNDTGLDGKTFFTGSLHFQMKEIEVFEISDSIAPTKSRSPALPEFLVSDNRKKHVNLFDRHQSFQLLH